MKGFNKFSPETKQLLTAEPDKSDKPITVLIRISGPLKEIWQQRLSQIGCKIRGVAGDVISVEVKREALFQLGEQDFVQYIEVTKPLYGERG